MKNKVAVKEYKGEIPACGCFCGACPAYTRDKNPCPGADDLKRCGKCKKFHLCCKGRNIRHCCDCIIFPCKKLKMFSKNWLKYGQDFIDNQKILKKVGEDKFRIIWNKKASNERKILFK